MTEEKKNNDDIPTFILNKAETSERKRSYKKYAIIAGSVVLIVAIILIAILVGVFLSSEAQKEIIKIAYTNDDNSNVEVTGDPNTNIVQFHFDSDTYESWIFNDFNRDIQVIKVRASIGTSCYVTPLNRTNAADPSEIASLASNNTKHPSAKHYMMYLSGSNPIADSSFLCKPARDACNGISTYWLYRSCNDSNESGDRKKRLPPPCLDTVNSFLCHGRRKKRTATTCDNVVTLFNCLGGSVV